MGYLAALSFLVIGIVMIIMVMTFHNNKLSFYKHQEFIRANRGSFLQRAASKAFDEEFGPQRLRMLNSRYHVNLIIIISATAIMIGVSLYAQYKWF